MYKLKLCLKKSKGIFKNIKYCLYFSAEASICFTLVRFLSRIFLALVPLGTTWCTKYLMDAISQHNKSNVQIRMICIGILLYAFFSVAALLIQKTNNYVTALHTEKLNHLLEKSMMSKAIFAEIELFDNTEYYNRFQNTKKDIYSIGNVVWNVIDLFSMVFSICGSGWIMWKLNPLASIFICMLSVPAVCYDYHYTHILYNWECGNVDNERQRNYLYTLATDKLYTQELRVYNIGESIKIRYKYLWNTYFENKESIIKKHMWKNIILLFPIEICKLSIIIYIIYGILNGKYTLGDFSLYLGVMGQMVNSIYVMITSLALVGENQMKIENVENFNRFCSKKIYEGERKLEDDIEICFKHVYFSYPGTEKLVLNDVNFVIHSGERIALVGTNGSGKSTIIKLLLRFYDVTEGKILLNNIPIEEYNITDLRKHFSVLFQNYVTYAFTVEENIRIEETMNIGNVWNKKEKKRYEKVIKESGLDAILDKLPEKDQTYITRRFKNNGVELSGGQYQKLALARALYRNGNIVLLDEPSSALDSKAEYEIFRAMDKCYENKTILFVTHRLDNVGFADKIIFIEDGRIKGIGKEVELLRNGCGYEKLWKISHLHRKKVDE